MHTRTRHGEHCDRFLGTYLPLGTFSNLRLSPHKAVVSKKFRMYLFGMQMMQLPMIAMGRLPLLRRYPTLGNIFFWAGLIWGFPLLAVG